MPLVFSLIVGTTSFLGAEQALEAVSTVVESEIAALDSALKSVLQSGSDLFSDISAVAEQKAEEVLSSQGVGTNVVPADSTDAELAAINEEQAVVIETAVVNHADTAESEILETAIVATEVIEIESPESDLVEIDSAEFADETDVAVIEHFDAEIVSIDVVTTASSETEIAETPVDVSASTDAVAETIDGDTLLQSTVLTNAWPDLSEHTRATILMLIEADQMTRE